MAGNFRKVPVLLGLILILGAGLRFYRLGAEGIWLDEGVSVARASSPVADITGGRSHDPSPALYYLLLHFWIDGFGDSEFSARAPSAVFGSLAILLVYLLGAAIGDRRSGLTAALFLALSAFPVYFSREARMYSLLLLLSLASFYCLIRMIRKPGKLYPLLYVFCTAGVLYTHNLGISTVLAQNIYALTVFLKKRRAGSLAAGRWYVLQGLLLLLYLPALGIFARQLNFVRGGYWSPAPAAGDLWWTIRDYGGSAAAAAALGLLAAGAAILPGRGEPAGRRDVPGVRTLLLSWLLTPILLPFFFSLAATPIYISRITIAATPALYLLAGRGAGMIPGGITRAAVTGLAGILLILPTADLYRPPRNEPWREVVRLLEEEAKAGDGVLVSPPWYRLFCIEYYRPRGDITILGIPGEAFDEPGVPELRREAGRFPRTWIVYFQPDDITALLEKNFPRRFHPEASRYLEYFNFQARGRMGIRVYLLGEGGTD